MKYNYIDNRLITYLEHDLCTGMDEDHGDLCVTFLAGSEQWSVAIGVLQILFCSMLYMTHVTHICTSYGGCLALHTG